MGKGGIDFLVIGGTAEVKPFLHFLRLIKGSDAVMVLDRDADSPGIKAAEELGIRTSTDFAEYLCKNDLASIIDLTGESVARTKLAEMGLPERGSAVIDGEAARLLYGGIKEAGEVREELVRLQRDNDIKDWGIKKTNEGIRTLYRELEKKKEELERLNQMKSDFISTVSHELRTPLVVIRETVAQVMEGILGATTPQQREFLGICLQDIDRLERIINDLLDMAKLEKGKIEVKRKIVNLVEVIKNIRMAFLSKAGKKQLEIRVRSSGDKVEIYSDEDKIKQIFNNLVGNAVKFTEEGYVEMSVEEKGNKIECYVADTGRGINKEDILKLFDKFQQFGRTSGPGEKGTGLGLAITKGIIDLYGGEIKAESALNEGTKFIFSFPKQTAEEVFREVMSKAFGESEQNSTSLSAAIFRVKNAESVLQTLGQEKMTSAMNSFEDAIEGNLHRSGDVVVKAPDRFYVVLPATSKENAMRVKERVLKAIRSVMSDDESFRKIEIEETGISYPDDGRAIEELLEKVLPGEK